VDRADILRLISAERGSTSTTNNNINNIIIIGSAGMRGGGGGSTPAHAGTIASGAVVTVETVAGGSPDPSDLT
jgi:hypothetical protein